MPAIDASLRRLQTDYIDVYQLHWPNRPHPNFGRHGINKIDFYKVDTKQQEEQMLSILEALNQAINAGKIRYCGLSNESAWGISKYIELSKKHNLPRMVSIQNEFSLIQTKDYPFTIEACVLEDVAYLPWSPLGAGVLSGKYLNGARPAGSRWTMGNRHGNFRDTQLVNQAVLRYVEIAQKYHITPSQLALAWCPHQKWITAPIIGATSMTQLKENIAAFNIELSHEALKEINDVKRAFPAPF
jgi:aryl-alcohol dehydrogenase-like predicted oxidoreductase